MDPFELSRKIKKKYGSNSPFYVARCLGIDIEYQNLGKVLGYYSKNFRIKIIHINEKASEHKKEFICAHELSHAINDPDENTSFYKKNTFFVTDKRELTANLFAIDFLFYQDFIDGSISFDDALNKYGVPKSFLMRIHQQNELGPLNLSS